MLPSGLLYLPGSLSATSGTPDDTQAPMLQWSGEVLPSAPVTITYSTEVTLSVIGTLTNTANISALDYGPITRTAMLRISWYRQYLPLVLR